MWSAAHNRSLSKITSKDHMVIDEKQIKEITDNVMGIKTELEKSGERGKKVEAAMEKIDGFEKMLAQILKDVEDMKRFRLTMAKNQREIRPGSVVTDECAEWIAATFITGLQAKGVLKNHFSQQGEAALERALTKSMGVLGIQ